MLGPENLLRDWIRAAEDSLPGASASSRAQVAEEAASRARRLAQIAAALADEAEDLLLSVEHRMASLPGADWEG